MIVTAVELFVKIVTEFTCVVAVLFALEVAASAAVLALPAGSVQPSVRLGVVLEFVAACVQYCAALARYRRTPPPTPVGECFRDSFNCNNLAGNVETGRAVYLPCGDPVLLERATSVIGNSGQGQK